MFIKAKRQSLEAGREKQPPVEPQADMNSRLSPLKDEGLTARNWWMASIIYVLFSILKWTWRKSEDSFPDEIQKRLEERKPVLVAHWHEDEWALLGIWSSRGAHTLVSLSKDGGAMTRFLELCGWKVSRGSSSKAGATGLLSLIRSVKKSGWPLVTMAVDGPRGPRRRSKKGILKLATTLKAPVLVMASSASKRFVFKKSWSKAYLPLPFAKVKIVYPKFLTAEEIEDALSKDDSAETIYKLEESLKAAKKLAVEVLNG